jgi:IS605 OrfB family transposase
VFYLNREYENYQRYIKGDRSVELYSATKQQADRFLARLRKTGGSIDPEKEYPLLLRRGVYKAETKLTPYWIKIPVYGVKGGINIPIGVSEPIPDGAGMKQAELIRRDGVFYVYMVVEKEVGERGAQNVIAVDLGIRHTATVLGTRDMHPKFYGKEVRCIRAHFFRLRRTLQKKGAYGAVKKIGSHEKRAVNNYLHVYAKRIVEEAFRTNSVIVVGRLKGIRMRGGGKGRVFQRRLSSFPFYRFVGYLKYKAAWLGVKVIEVSEAWASQTCHNCGCKGFRFGGYFYCSGCGHEYNADYNGVCNILKRG